MLQKSSDTVGEPLLPLSRQASLLNDLGWQGAMMSSKTYGYRVRQQYPNDILTPLTDTAICGNYRKKTRHIILDKIA